MPPRLYDPLYLPRRYALAAMLHKLYIAIVEQPERSVDIATAIIQNMPRL